VTPYRTQALMLVSALRDLGRDDAIDAATVHRFQGSERDVVVVDLVDAPPLDRVSRLTGAHDDATRRLITVALSRARGKVVVLADVSFLRAHSPSGSPVLSMLRLMADGDAPDPLTVQHLAPCTSVAWSRTPGAAGVTSDDALTTVRGTDGVTALVEGSRFASLAARACGGQPRLS
jgi:AAA domain